MNTLTARLSKMSMIDIKSIDNNELSFSRPNNRSVNLIRQRTRFNVSQSLPHQHRFYLSQTASQPGSVCDR